MPSFSQKNPRDTLKIASTQLARLAHGGLEAWNRMKSSTAKPAFTKGRIEIGILIRIGDEQNPLHLYPVPK